MDRLNDSGLAGAAAGRFAALGLLDEAGPLLEPLQWDGTVATGAVVGDGGRRAAALDPRSRHAKGIYYTPASVASGLTSMVLDGGEGSARVGDPACGAGAFLLAAAERLYRAGVPTEAVITERLFGCDSDPVAVDLTRIRLALWAAEHSGAVHTIPSDHLVVADALDPGTRAWVDRRGVVDVVLGNPPFGSQLKGATVRDASTRSRVASLLGVGSLGYADTAALFLARALQLVDDDGVVALILPTSVAAARGSATIRAFADRLARIESVWIGGDHVGFDAAVSVWAPVFRRPGPGSPTGGVERRGGPEFTAIDTVPGPVGPNRWASLLTTGVGGRPEGVGMIPMSSGPGAGQVTVGDVASVTAGFRRHFYGLAPHVHADPGRVSDFPVLVTTGAIDPMHHRVADPVRFAGRDLTRPVVDVASLASDDEILAAWVRSMCVPKVLVASQGRVVEAIVDVDGTLIPSTPVVAVVPRPDGPLDVWQLGALLSSPLVAWDLHRTAAGTGMGVGTCRVSVAFVAGCVVPDDAARSAEAADRARTATDAARLGDPDGWRIGLDRLGRAMAAGHSDVFDWWRGQRPGWRGARLLER